MQFELGTQLKTFCSFFDDNFARKQKWILVTSHLFLCARTELPQNAHHPRLRRRVRNRREFKQQDDRGSAGGKKNAVGT
jgi:hypothetical protein